jgi:hypothetical protein
MSRGVLRQSDEAERARSWRSITQTLQISFPAETGGTDQRLASDTLEDFHTYKFISNENQTCSLILRI